MKIILSVIAVCLVMITVKLYTPDAEAEVDGMFAYDLYKDPDFNQAVKTIIEQQCIIMKNSIFIIC